MPLVDIKDLTFAYAGKQEPVLNKLNLEIEKGSLSIITGVSGCGKSTLGKALAGYLFQNTAGQYSGTISINGIDMTKIPLYEASQRVAYVQQNPEDQFCTLTVADEIAFGLENNRLPPSEIERKIDEALILVSGNELKDRYLSTLSGGEKQKIAIAAMFALSPDILILDEPTSNLDPAATEKVFKTLDEIRQKEELTIIIIEHKLNQLTDLQPDILFMTKGKIIKLDAVSGYWSSLRACADDIPRLPQFPASLTSNDTNPLLVMEGVSIKKSGQLILKHIDLEIKKGDFIALMGPNGSGKTTMLQGIAGLVPTETGKRVGFGLNLDEQPISQLVHEIGYMFQNPNHQIGRASCRERV
jgi:energy-coupling factor transport system ATP-binding protein